jgi:hypothetical protein
MDDDHDKEVSQEGAVDQRLKDTGTPDYKAAFDSDEAERIAFREDALSEQDARDSACDL